MKPSPTWDTTSSELNATPGQHELHMDEKKMTTSVSMGDTPCHLFTTRVCNESAISDNGVEESRVEHTCALPRCVRAKPSRVPQEIAEQDEPSVERHALPNPSQTGEPAHGGVGADSTLLFLFLLLPLLLLLLLLRATLARLTDLGERGSQVSVRRSGPERSGLVRGQAKRPLS